MGRKFSEIESELRQASNARTFSVPSGRLLIADPYMLGWASVPELSALFQLSRKREQVFGGNTGMTTLPHGVVYATSTDGDFEVYDRGKSLESFGGIKAPPVKLRLIEIAEEGIPKRITGIKDPDFVAGCDLATLLIGDAGKFVIPESEYMRRYGGLGSDEVDLIKRESAQVIQVNPGTYTWRVQLYVREGLYEETLDPQRIIRIVEAPNGSS